MQLLSQNVISGQFFRQYSFIGMLQQPIKRLTGFVIIFIGIAICWLLLGHRLSLCASFIPLIRKILSLFDASRSTGAWYPLDHGTSPALLVVGKTAGLIGEKTHHSLYRLASLIMIATGLWFIYSAVRM
jgi:hypothetical protein